MGNNTGEVESNAIKSDINYSFIDKIYDGVFGKSIDRWTMLIPGSGCEWARKKHAGCQFCAFHHIIDAVTGGKLFPHDEIMEIFELSKSKVVGTSPRLLSIFNGGNFINDNEIVASAQMAMLEYAANHPTVEKILIESKTEYLSARKLEACLKAVGSKKLRIAIGLESKDDYLRNTVINKGMTKEAYERAIRRLHDLGIEVQSYVFMKPPTITEKKAIEEAIDTINYAVDSGSDTIMLEAGMVQKNTGFEKEYLKGEYDSPWLWSIREVVEKTRHHKQMNVGIFDEEPKPISYPKNCERCTDKFNISFHTFRETNDFNALATLSCECKNNWENILNK